MNAQKLLPARTLPVVPAYSIKRHGLTLDTCASEPVHTPGCVQAHGAMLVLRLSDLRILQASENTEAILGHGPERLLGQSSSIVLGSEGVEKLRRLLAKEPADCNPLYLLTMAGTKTRQEDTPAASLDVTVHSVGGVAILEFEATGRTDAANPDYYGLVKKTVARLHSANSLQQFCESVAQEMRALTGFDRVMIHKFHEDGHGEIIAESRHDDLATWTGMHYPAEDIPQPTRAIFQKTWIRPVPDVNDALAELVPLTNPDTGMPLDMTYCALRGASAMYTEYLQNMQVISSLTMPIRRSEKLWGLIACHHYDEPKHVPYQVRAACEFVAQVASLQHQTAEEKEHLAYRYELEIVHRQLIAAATEGGGLAVLTSGTPSLLDGIHAEGAAIYHLDRWWCVGKTPSEEQLAALGDWLLTQMSSGSQHPMYVSNSLVRDYPAATSFASVASGLLALRIALSGRNLMVWFRPATAETVNWRGDPNYDPRVLGPHGVRLTPRRSFEVFAESVEQRSQPWLAVEIEAASALRLAVMEMVVDRAARLTSLNADLARSNAELDAFAYVASHDLKEPLRGIAQYASQLLDDAGQVDIENRTKLYRLKQLTMRMDGLLDSLLQFSRVGRAELTFEAVDLNDVLAEAIQMVSSRAFTLPVVVPRALPPVNGNRASCREILVNLLSNARKFTDDPNAAIEVGYIEASENHPRPGLPDVSVGHTIFYISDKGIGIEPRYFEQVFKLFKRLHGREDYGGGGGAGLTIARKLVEGHAGRVWLDSKPGHGTTVYFTLPGGDQN